MELTPCRHMKLFVSNLEQVNGTKLYTFRWTTLRDKHCRHPIAVMGVVDTFVHQLLMNFTYQQFQKFPIAYNFFMVHHLISLQHFPRTKSSIMQGPDIAVSKDHTTLLLGNQMDLTLVFV